MYSPKELSRFLFLDVETAAGHASHAELPELMQKHWERRAARILRKDPGEPVSTTEAAETYAGHAGIFAEFGRIVCISCGYVRFEGETPRYHFKSFYGQDERALLSEFAELLRHNVGPNQYPWQFLCGHNIKEFDVPYIARRCLIQGLLPLPDCLNIAGKKPWEVPHIDTMELWKFGDYKSFTALELLATLLQVPTPKSDIDGSQVSGIFWQQGDINRIAAYCERDVAATISVLLRMCGQPIAGPETITYSVNP
ncbi:MAG: ribonuclease H-like domain-containing protein [Bacteroidetes bacterium]|nr:ribonuclease H-like domain-containing protein [Bacteroidota bacterium]